MNHLASPISRCLSSRLLSIEHQASGVRESLEGGPDEPLGYLAAHVVSDDAPLL